jgi:hypothetical protein
MGECSGRYSVQWQLHPDQPISRRTMRRSSSPIGRLVSSCWRCRLARIRGDSNTICSRIVSSGRARTGGSHPFDAGRPTPTSSPRCYRRIRQQFHRDRPIRWGEPCGGPLRRLAALNDATQIAPNVVGGQAPARSATSGRHRRCRNLAPVVVGLVALLETAEPKPGKCGPYRKRITPAPPPAD